MDKEEIVMTLSHNTQKLAMVTALIMICFMWFRSCEHKNATISDLRSTAEADSLKFVIQEDRSALQEEVIIKQKKTFKHLLKEVNGLRDANRQLKANVKTEVTALPVAAQNQKPKVITIRDTVPGQIPGNFLRLPQSYGFEDNWKGIYYSIDSTGESQVDRMWFVNKPVITFGYEKKPFPGNIFSRRKPVVSYLDENPHSQIQGLQNYTFDPPVKWYKKKGVVFGFGVLSGIFTANQLIK